MYFFEMSRLKGLQALHAVIEAMALSRSHECGCDYQSKSGNWASGSAINLEFGNKDARSPRFPHLKVNTSGNQTARCLLSVA